MRSTLVLSLVVIFGLASSRTVQADPVGGGQPAPTGVSPALATQDGPVDPRAAQVQQSEAAAASQETTTEWWFWVVVGGVLVIVLLGVAVARKPQSSPTTTLGHMEAFQ
jgi:hypothetical protein